MCADRFGEVDPTFGSLGGVDVVHLARHADGHARLSNHVVEVACHAGGRGSSGVTGGTSGKRDVPRSPVPC